jgi:hypothetical protein
MDEKFKALCMSLVGKGEQQYLQKKQLYPNVCVKLSYVQNQML